RLNDTEFIHVDFEEGKRVLAWKRGRPGVDDPVVVVANFSDFATARPFDPASEYRVANWPTIPAASAGARSRRIASAACMGRPRTDLPMGGQGLRRGLTAS